MTITYEAYKILPKKLVRQWKTIVNKFYEGM